jgi:hypothetical protein
VIVVNVAMMFAALVLLVVVSSLFPYLVVFLFPAVIILFTSSYCSCLSFCWRWRLVVELVGFAFLVGLCYLAVVIGLLLALVVCCWVVALVD